MALYEQFVERLSMLLEGEDSLYNPIFITYAALIIMAILPIYYGSKSSVEEGKEAGSEKLSQSDAYWFPVIGSAFLFGFYLLFKHFGKEYINILLTAYFACFGAISLQKIYASCMLSILPTKWVYFDYFTLKMERKSKGSGDADDVSPLFDIKITWVHVAMAVCSAATTLYYVWTKNWISSNVFGEAFAMSAISMIQLDSFGTGMTLLAGLFFYDIFWVFGTDVMVTVATSFDVPVKLLFPRDVISSPHQGFSMLGLGDIVIPGVLIALCLKFDIHNRQLGKRSWFTNPYFTVSLCFYLLGLITTMSIMHIFKAAQPALLYLSPAGIFSVFLTALCRGEIREMWNFSTDEQQPEKISQKQD